jgi:hypothetical protein
MPQLDQPRKVGCVTQGGLPRMVAGALTIEGLGGVSKSVRWERSN